MGKTKTQVRVYLSIFGDSFPLEDITEKLGIEPSNTYRKGDRIPNRSSKLLRKETSWHLDTGYQESFDVEEQLQQIIMPLQNKVSIIQEIKQTYSVVCKFYIVIIMEEGDTPSLYLDKDVINFVSSIGAEFDIDLYANPYEDDFCLD